MAIQPSIRPVGSSYRIRFEGNLVVGDANPSTVNGTFPSTVDTTPAAGYDVTVRFALADMTALTDTRKRLPVSSYDNDSPDTINIESQDWCANVIVRAYEGAATAKTTATRIFSHIDTLGSELNWERDTASTGLKQSTGVPVLLLKFYCTGVAMPSAQTGNVPVVVDIWFPPSPVR